MKVFHQQQQQLLQQNQQQNQQQKQDKIVEEIDWDQEFQNQKKKLFSGINTSNLNKILNNFQLSQMIFVGQLQGLKKILKNNIFQNLKNQNEITISASVLYNCMNIPKSIEGLVKQNKERAENCFSFITHCKINIEEDLQNLNDKNLQQMKEKLNNLNTLWLYVIKFNIVTDVQKINQYFKIILQLLTKFGKFSYENTEKIIRLEKNYTNKMSLEQEFDQEEEQKISYAQFIQKQNNKYQTLSNSVKQEIYSHPHYMQYFQGLNLNVFNEKETIQILKNFIVSFVDSQEFGVKECEVISQICQFYNLMLQLRATNNKLQMTIELANSQNLVEALLGVIEKKFSYDIAGFAQYSNQTCHILKLFTRLYRQRLILLDDEEFYGRSDNALIEENMDFQQNFPKQTLQNLSNFLNKFAYRVIFVENKKQFLICKSSLTKLLKELYDRDKRKNFTNSEDFWVIEEANQDIFNQYHYKLVTQDTKFVSDLIQKIPHIFTFKKRFDKMNKYIIEDQQGQDRNPFDFYQDEDEEQEDQEEQVYNQLGQPQNSKIVVVRRGYELNDAYNTMRNSNMKTLYRIKFLNEQGQEEAGIDGGGILKEFLTIIIKQSFDTNRALFKEADDKTWYPNPEYYIEDGLDQYVFIGKIVGKAIYENVLIEPVFSRVFLNQILGVQNNFEELQYFDKQFYNQMLFLKHTKDDVSLMDIYFAIDVIQNGGQVVQVELKPNGKNIQVTNQSKQEYIMLYSDYKLNKQNMKMAQMFRKGFLSVVDDKWLQMFSHKELQLTISGNFNNFDVEDLKKHTKYQGYSIQDKTVQDFWIVLSEFTVEEKQKLLYFVTSCSRPPTLGFIDLNPPFCIQLSADNENFYKPQKLPTSSTCMNVIKIPDYQNKQTLKEKLLVAINSNAGFDLT